MTVYLQALETNQRLGIDMERDIAAYCCHGGYVFIGPDYVMWGKPVRRDKGDPDTQWNAVDPDAWYVRFACGKGSLKRFIELTPYYLPYTGWKRQVRARGVQYYKTNIIKRF